MAIIHLLMHTYMVIHIIMSTHLHEHHHVHVFGKHANEVLCTGVSSFKCGVLLVKDHIHTRHHGIHNTNCVKPQILQGGGLLLSVVGHK